MAMDAWFLVYSSLRVIRLFSFFYKISLPNCHLTIDQLKFLNVKKAVQCMRSDPVLVQVCMYNTQDIILLSFGNCLLVILHFCYRALM